MTGAHRIRGPNPQEDRPIDMLGPEHIVEVISTAELSGRRIILSGHLACSRQFACYGRVVEGKLLRLKPSRREFSIAILN